MVEYNKTCGVRNIADIKREALLLSILGRLTDGQNRDELKSTIRSAANDVAALMDAISSPERLGQRLEWLSVFLAEADQETRDMISREIGSEIDFLSLEDYGNIFSRLKDEHPATQGECDRLGMRSSWDWLVQRELIAAKRAAIAMDRELRLQKPYRFFPGLKSQPFWALETFEWVPRLKAAGPTIHQEMKQLRADGLFQPYVVVEGLAKGQKRTVKKPGSKNYSDWNGFFLRSPYIEGRRKEFIERCPFTAELISSIPRINWNEMLFFSALTPGTTIPAHYGPTNAHLRVHLCLEGGSGCYIRVGDHVRRWENGEVLIFDDSYEHGVVHEGPDVRVNLMLSIIHPEMPTWYDPPMPEITDDEAPFEN